MLIPAPHSSVAKDGTAHLTGASRIRIDSGAEQAGALLQGMLRAATPWPWAEGSDADAANAAERVDIHLRWDDGLAAEAYAVDATPERITLSAGTPRGLMHAVQTLLQLLPADVYRAAPAAAWDAIDVPCVLISDRPRYRWRGLMLDVARHFAPKQEVLRVIDLLSMHKMNVLHLHLSDDQGWRMEITRYPRLTSVGAWRRHSQVGHGTDAFSSRRPHGGFYTQSELREIVAYAARRGITVVPELDCPGHAQAAIAAYPELGLAAASPDVSSTWGISAGLVNIEPATVEFFRTVLDEVMDVFPSTVIGIGGDECLTGPWEADDGTAARVEQLGLSGPSAIQPWFVAQMEAHVAARGRRLFAWDEVLDGPPSRSDTVIAAWRGRDLVTLAAAHGFDVVACPDTDAYLDFRQSDRDDEPIPVGTVLDLQRAFRFDPSADCGDTPHLLGGQVNLWTENIDTARMLDFYLFPRLCAFAEALWSGADGDFADFRERLQHHHRRLDAVGVEYRPEAGPHPWQTRPDAAGAPSSHEEHERVMAELRAGILPEQASPPMI